jgi:pyridoxine kinase
MRNPIPRVAAIHDLAAVGRCSLTAVIPLLSCMGVQVTPLPTAVLSSQTVGVEGFTLLDLTEEMPRIMRHWESMGLRFDGVYSGFMAGIAQMESVARCIQGSMVQGGLAVIDPVLGEDGVLIPTMTIAMVEKMRWLIGYADVITPDWTEVCLLLGEEYSPCVPLPTVKRWLRRLAALGPRVVVATSVPLSQGAGQSPAASVLAFDKENDFFWRIDCEYLPVAYPGTGDIFTSVLTGALLLGESLPMALDRATHFVTLGIRATFGQSMNPSEGIMIERLLGGINTPLSACACRLSSEGDTGWSE